MVPDVIQLTMPEGAGKANGTEKAFFSVTAGKEQVQEEGAAQTHEFAAKGQITKAEAQAKLAGRAASEVPAEEQTEPKPIQQKAQQKRSWDKTNPR